MAALRVCPSHLPLGPDKFAHSSSSSSSSSGLFALESAEEARERWEVGWGGSGGGREGEWGGYVGEENVSQRASGRPEVGRRRQQERVEGLRRLAALEQVSL